MKEKVPQICIRVSEKDKKKIKRNAKNCGLNISEYLRKVALKEEVYPIPDKTFYKIYLDICKVKNNLYDMKIERIDKCLEMIQNNFLYIYNSKKVGDDDGDNENLGS